MKNVFVGLDLEPMEYETNQVNTNRKASDVRIINSKKGGKRIVVKENFLKQLEIREEEELQLALSKIGESPVIILAKRGIAKTGYKIRQLGGDYAVYNTELIEKITEELDLDFTNVSTVGLEVNYHVENTEDVSIPYCIARKDEDYDKNRE